MQWISPEQVVHLLCRTLFARFMFFPRNARTKPVLLQLHLFVSFKLQLFRDCVQWSLGRSTGNSHERGLQTSEFGDSVVPRRGGFVTLLCHCLPKAAWSLFWEWLVLAFSCCRTGIVCPVSNPSCSGRAQLPAPILAAKTPQPLS